MPKTSPEHAYEKSSRITIIEDIQIGNADETQWVFLSAKPTPDGKEIIFRAELVKQSADQEENITLRVDYFTVAQFSAWWKRKTADGWKVVS